MSSVEEYKSDLFLILMAARALAGVDVSKRIAEIERAHAIGPIVDPTLWMKKREAMEQDRDLLRAALPLAELGRRLVEAAEHTCVGAELAPADETEARWRAARTKDDEAGVGFEERVERNRTRG